MTTISTSELRARFDDPRLTIVDVRPLAAYNGWRLNGEARGGHIPGAVAFPIAWLDIVDEAEIERSFRAKGIVAGREVVIYGDGADDAGALATKLGRLGINGAHVYAAGASASTNVTVHTAAAASIASGERRFQSAGSSSQLVSR